MIRYVRIIDLSKKKLIGWEIEVVSTTSTTSISFKTKTKKIEP